MEDFLKLYASALEKKVEKLCEILERNNFKEELKDLEHLKDNMMDSSKVEALIVRNNIRWLGDYYFANEEENSAWKKSLDFSDFPLLPHYYRLKVREYKDNSLEESINNSLNVLHRNAKTLDDQKLISKLEETISNINDLKHLESFLRIEDWLIHTEFDNFENGIVDYRQFLIQLFLEVNIYVQKLKDIANPPVFNMELYNKI